MKLLGKPFIWMFSISTCVSPLDSGSTEETVKTYPPGRLGRPARSLTDQPVALDPGLGQFPVVLSCGCGRFHSVRIRLLQVLFL